ncbi:hypothetical protein F5Y10DRAFT_271807 [Nemania abortiva]|nr:hypothetical protein F5Y10DRAFT_271807 [Nemania abortiva]
MRAIIATTDITTAIAFVDSITVAYEAFRNVENLPVALTKVRENMNLVRETLTSARDTMKYRGEGEAEIAEVIQRCKTNLERLKTIFDKIAKKANSGKSKETGSALSEWYKNTFYERNKRTEVHRIECSMKAILEDLILLATCSRFRFADRAKELRERLRQWVDVVPSLLDSDFEDAVTVGATQEISDNATGYQNDGSGLIKHTDDSWEIIMTLRSDL